LVVGSVGFVGVGAMGSSIAGRLVGSYDLLVTDKNPAAADELVGLGAKFVSVDEIVEACSVILLCLPGPDNVTDLLLGESGIAKRLRPGTVVVDMTTSTPTVDVELVAALKDRDAAFIDAAIAGGVRRARAGTAVLMVGADPNTFAQVQDLLLTVTPEVINVGPVGTGHAMKLVSNMLNNCNRFAAMEAIRLGVLAGLKQHVILEVLNKGSGRNYATEYTYPEFLSGETYLPQGFTLELTLKDLRLANQLAEALGHDTTIGHLVQKATESAVERFGGDADQNRLMADWYDR
jgi:3-hydroxyisobutyrate dehydrogenase-like beta-hydroxyacid dehydrogenase